MSSLYHAFFIEYVVVKCFKSYLSFYRKLTCERNVCKANQFFLPKIFTKLIKSLTKFKMLLIHEFTNHRSAIVNDDEQMITLFKNYLCFEVILITYATDVATKRQGLINYF